MVTTHSAAREHQYRVQTAASFLSTTAVLGVNLYLGWATHAALMHSVWILIAYNVFDTVYGFHEYWQHDRIYLVHHACACGCVAMGAVLLHWGDASTRDSVQRLATWLMLAEVTTHFNNVRLLTRTTRLRRVTQMLFAVAFLVGRSAMTLGALMELRRHPPWFLSYVAPFCAILNGLNLYWSAQILRKVRSGSGSGSAAHVPKWLEITRVIPFAILPLLAIHNEVRGRTMVALAQYVASIVLTCLMLRWRWTPRPHAS